MAEEARGRAVNPACPNAANPFHRCAEYCPVAAPAGKSPPPPGRAAQNGNGAHGDGEEAGGGGARRQAVNPDCPNADNPFHRCADYCPVAPPAVKSPPLPAGLAAQNGRTHSDGDLQPRTRRRDRAGGSGGGLPLYVFLREGSDGEGKKVDPRCPNAPNPFHVCTNHCLAKMVDGGRSSEGGKSPFPSSPAIPAAPPPPPKMAASSPGAARRRIQSARMPATLSMNVESIVLSR